MKPELIKALAAIRSYPDLPHHNCPGYEHWLAEQVWNSAIKHCASMSGPKCAEAILEAAGVACCEQNEQGGKGWFEL